MATSEEIEAFGTLLPEKTSMSAVATPPSSSARTAAMTWSSLSNRQVTRLASTNR